MYKDDVGSDWPLSGDLFDILESLVLPTNSLPHLKSTIFFLQGYIRDDGSDTGGEFMFKETFERQLTDTWLDQEAGRTLNLKCRTWGKENIYDVSEVTAPGMITTSKTPRPGNWQDWYKGPEEPAEDVRRQAQEDWSRFDFADMTE